MKCSNMEHASDEKIIRIWNAEGKSLDVVLTPEGDRLLGRVVIDDVPYHVVYIPGAALTSEYCVDVDPDYIPRCDAKGFCFLLAPYSN